MPKETSDDALLRVKETAAILKVCVRTVRRMIQGEKHEPLPVVRMGRSIRVRKADLDRYIAAHRHDF